MRGLATPLARALAALLLVVTLGAIWNANGTFFARETHLATLRAGSVVGVLAIGMTFVILAAGIDLSVGSMLGLCGMAFASLSFVGGWGAWFAVPAVMLLGALGGLCNGLLAAAIGLQAFIATLATMSVARGLAKYLPAIAGETPGTKIQPPPGQIDGTPFMQAMSSSVLGVPLVGVVFAAVALAAAVVLHKTVFGRHVMAVGGNECAARLSGVPVMRTRILTYVICGACAGLAAVMQVAQSRLGDPEAGTMFELRAIAAVVIGGTALTGGRGGVLLTLVGVLTIGTIEKVLSINGVREHWRLVVQGAIIVAAVLLQRRRT